MPLNISHSLLVEDNAIIAMDCEDMLRDLGAEIVEVCATVDEALSYLSRNAVDFALLDLNIGSGTSLPVATRLTESQTPFIFATGEEASQEISSLEYKTVVLQKPYTLHRLEEALTDLKQISQ